MSGIVDLHVYLLVQVKQTVKDMLDLLQIWNIKKDLNLYELSFHFQQPAGLFYQLLFVCKAMAFVG